jgi:hypothetical protein
MAQRIPRRPLRDAEEAVSAPGGDVLLDGDVVEPSLLGGTADLVEDPRRVRELTLLGLARGPVLDAALAVLVDIAVSDVPLIRREVGKCSQVALIVAEGIPADRCSATLNRVRLNLTSAIRLAEPRVGIHDAGARRALCGRRRLRGRIARNGIRGWWAGGCRGRGENHDGRRRLCRVRHPQIADPVAHVGDGWAGVVDHHEQQREENHHQEDVPDSAENVERGHRLVLFLSCVARTDRLGRLPLRLEC